MPNTEHTPGPWAVSEGDFSVRGRTGGRVASFLPSYATLPGNAYRANARLIAAAPDLLAALIAAKAALIAYGAKDGSVYNGVCAAIAKARGTEGGAA